MKVPYVLIISFAISYQASAQSKFCEEIAKQILGTILKNSSWALGLQIHHLNPR